MNKRKRQRKNTMLPSNNVRRTPRLPAKRTIAFWTATLVFLAICGVYVGNKLLTTTKVCTVTGTNVEIIDSNGGRIPFQTPLLSIYSRECPPIAFSHTPPGYESFEQVRGTLIEGQAYEFEVGFFRLELLGLQDFYWKGVRVSPVDG